MLDHGRLKGLVAIIACGTGSGVRWQVLSLAKARARTRPNGSPGLKGAIANFTTGLAGFAAKKRLRVNAIAPGRIRLPLIPPTMAARKGGNFGKNIPLGRLGPGRRTRPCALGERRVELSYSTGLYTR